MGSGVISSVETGDYSLGRLAGVLWTHDLLACISDGVVSLMLGDLDALSGLSRKNVVAAIALVVNVLCTHHRPHFAVVVILGKLLPVRRVVVVQIKQVVSCSALVLFSCIELVSLHGDDFVSTLVILLHVFKPADLTNESLLTQMGPFVLHLIILLLAHFLVSHGEILVKSLLLCVPEKSFSQKVELATYLRRSGSRWDQGCEPQPHPQICGNRLYVPAVSNSRSVLCLS